MPASWHTAVQKRLPGKCFGHHTAEKFIIHNIVTNNIKGKKSYSRKTKIRKIIIGKFLFIFFSSLAKAIHFLVNQA